MEAPQSQNFKAYSVELLNVVEQNFLIALNLPLPLLNMMGSFCLLSPNDAIILSMLRIHIYTYTVLWIECK